MAWARKGWEQKPMRIYGIIHTARLHTQKKIHEIHHHVQTRTRLKHTYHVKLSIVKWREPEWDGGKNPCGTGVAVDAVGTPSHELEFRGGAGRRLPCGICLCAFSCAVRCLLWLLRCWHFGLMLNPMWWRIRAIVHDCAFVVHCIWVWCGNNFLRHWPRWRRHA